ncbi:MAG TPA: phage holin family protein [Chitinophagaceae bacterium]|jgi:hypothetical protein|nr:phage holin family protein [Chitinophagaceae bacterium]
MEDIKDKTEELISHTGEYLDTFFKVSLLKVTKKTTDIASAAIGLMVTCVLGLLVLFFAGFGAAWWLGDIMDSRIGGFMVVAGFFIVIAFILISLRRKIVFPFIRNSLIRKIYEEHKN